MSRINQGIIPPYMAQKQAESLQKDLERIQKSDQLKAEQEIKQQVTQQTTNINISNSIRENRMKIQDTIANKTREK